MRKKNPSRYGSAASITLVNKPPDGDVNVRISIDDRDWYMSPDDAREVFIALAIHNAYTGGFSQSYQQAAREFESAYQQGYDHGKEDIKRLSREALETVMKKRRKKVKAKKLR